MNHSLYLIHYASPYYDPVKAHEYYMEHRKLKGRRSSSSSTRRGTLNETGKEAKEYVKNQIYSERDKRLNDEDASANGRIEQNNREKQSFLDKNSQERDKEITQYSDKTNKVIDQLYERLTTMSQSELSENAQTIRGMIERLRANNESMKKQITSAYAQRGRQINSQYSRTASSIHSESSNTKKTIRQESRDKLNAELDAIYANPKFLKSSRKKKS